MYLKAELKELINILRSIKEVNKEVIISYEDKVIISAIAEDTTIYNLTKISKDFFMEVKEWKGYFSFNLEEVTRRLRYLKKYVEIYVEENKLCLSEGKTLFKLPLFDIKANTKHKPFKSDKPDAVYLLSPSVLANAISKASMCSYTFNLIADGKNLVIETYDSLNYYKEALEVGEVANGSGKLKLTNSVLERLTPIGKLTDKTILNIYNDKLLTVNVNGEHYSLNYMIAPRADND